MTMGEVIYKTLPQSTLSYSLSPVGKGHAIAKRVWETKADMLAYLKDEYGSAVPGIILVVTKDSNIDNNGAYLVRQAAGVDGVTPDQIQDNEVTLVKLATGETENISLNLKISRDVEVAEYDSNTNTLTIQDMRSRWETEF